MQCINELNLPECAELNVPVRPGTDLETDRLDGLLLGLSVRSYIAYSLISAVTSNVCFLKAEPVLLIPLQSF